MTLLVEKKGLQIAGELADFVEREVLPDTGITAEQVWAAMAGIVDRFGPATAQALAERERMQEQLNAWHAEHRGAAFDRAAYERFLTGIGYLLPEPEQPAPIAPRGTDAEIATTCGPQLVVPSSNLHMVMRACNARWGSLYDALYASDVLGSPAPKGGYDAARGAQVIAWAKAHLDSAAPLSQGTWAEVTGLSVAEGALVVTQGARQTALRAPAQFAGFTRADDGALATVILRANGLHMVLVLDGAHAIGKDDPAHLADIRLEAAVTTIVDLEDSVACVDAEDKVAAYRNWLGLMRGTLSETKSDGSTLAMQPDIDILRPDGSADRLRGRSLMLVRNVGLLMTTPAVLDARGQEVPEHLLDALITVLCALHDLRRQTGPKNSATGSVYVVKPKMHSPQEVALCDALFGAVEQALGLAEGTVKIGIMDEERRMSLNLAAAIQAAPGRVCFINTGFLDRTGDEIHSCMEAGPMRRKAEMQVSGWLAAYEARNVDAGLACGLKGQAQIGKGMWTKPDRMAEMMAAKIGHLQAGGTTAWVPSPRAAVLHACHYHGLSVFDRLEEIAAEGNGAARAPRSALLEVPVLERDLTQEEIRAELENSCQGILGYVVRWVDQGIGCSKVPDINDVGLMEDRATLRISAQGLANWLHHGLICEETLRAAMAKMAAVVDRQNAGDPAYRPMTPDLDGEAFRCALDLVLEGRRQPSGYTEPLLHAARARVKAAA